MPVNHPIYDVVVIGGASMVSVLRWMPWGEGYRFFYVKKMT